jgi:hypothetical protein
VVATRCVGRGLASLSAGIHVRYLRKTISSRDWLRDVYSYTWRIFSTLAEMKRKRRGVYDSFTITAPRSQGHENSPEPIH